MLAIVFFIFQLANVSLFGFLCSRAILRKEPRLVIVLPLGLLIGTIVYNLLVSYLAYVLPLLTSIVLANVLFGLANLLFLYPFWHSRQIRWQWFQFLEIGLSRMAAFWLGLASLVLIILTIVTTLNSQLGNNWGGNDEGQFIQYTFVSSILRGNYPPINPYEPDYPLLYHWTYNLFAAALSRTLQSWAGVGILLANIWINLLLLWCTTGLIYRFTGKIYRGLFVSAIMLFGTNTFWLLGVGNASLTEPGFGGLANWFRDNSELGLTSVTNLDLMSFNFTIPFGYLIFIGAVWCFLELYRQEYRNTVGLLVTIACIAELVGTGEALVVGFLAAIACYSWVLALYKHNLNFARLKSEWRALFYPIALGLIGLAVSFPIQSVFTTLFSKKTGGFSFTLTEHPGALPGIRHVFFPIFHWSFLPVSGFLPLCLIPIGIWYGRSV